MGFHIDDICLKIFGFRVEGYCRQEEGGCELLMRAYGLLVLRRKADGVRMREGRTESLVITIY
ncbi:hypothetical protein BS036_01960 [Vibrio parahaemolyticus]|nr:hypothetical protein [Vibrio parahaemolyticus]KFD81264.1 hypothetical protein DA89_1387 [Vibrio paracholerae]